MVFVV